MTDNAERVAPLGLIPVPKRASHYRPLDVPKNEWGWFVVMDTGDTYFVFTEPHEEKK